MDWQTLATRYGDRVLLVARNILRDESLALDAAQEAMLKLRRTNGQVENWDAWVLTVAGNTARDCLRRQKRRPLPLTVEEDRMKSTAETPVEVAVARESRERVRAALTALPAPDRDILLLKFREGLSGHAIAAALDVSLTTAWQRLSRALKALKKKLGE